MNIELHGFRSNQINETVRFVLGKLIDRFGVNAEIGGFVVTFVSATSSDMNGLSAPFFRVYSDQVADFVAVTELLRDVEAPWSGMRTFVECVLLERRTVL